MTSPNARLWRIIHQQAAQIVDLKAQLADQRIGALERRVDALERDLLASNPMFTAPVNVAPGCGHFRSGAVAPGEVRLWPVGPDGPVVASSDPLFTDPITGVVHPISQHACPSVDPPLPFMDTGDLNEYADGAGLRSGIFKGGY